MSTLPCPANGGQNRHFLQILRRLLVAVTAAFLLAGGPARAEEPEDIYLQIFTLIQDADFQSSRGETAKAHTNYSHALTSLRGLQVANPNWSPRLVSFRMKYLIQKLNPSPDPVAMPSATVGASPSKPAAAKSDSQITLLTAGAEPRKVLRLHPQPGNKQSMNISIQMGVGIKMGEIENPAMKLPPMQMAVDMTVKGVSPEGDITYELFVNDATIGEDPDASSQIAESMRTSLGLVKGLSGAGTMTSRGVSKTMNLKAPNDIDAQARQAMEQMKDSLIRISSPLPEEAVGVGAKWKVEMPINSQGMTITQVATYELVSVDGETVKTKTALTQTAANQKIENPQMPGMKLDLVKLSGKGGGETTLNLSQLIPSAGALESHSDLSLGMNLGAQKQTMSMTVDMKMLMEAK